MENGQKLQSVDEDMVAFVDLVSLRKYGQTIRNISADHLEV
jgi:hypothetical protein